MDIEHDATRVAQAILDRLPPIVPSRDSAWEQPAAASVIDCVLSLNRNYDAVVAPRVRAFRQKFPAVLTVRQLDGLIRDFPSCHDFVRTALNYNDIKRAGVLQAVVKMLMDLIGDADSATEERVLRDWAANATAMQGSACPIVGFKLAGWQYLRMLFGADTAKPDVHIVRFVETALRRSVTPQHAHSVLHRAAEQMGVRALDLDTSIWEWAARKSKVAAKTEPEIVHLFPWNNHPSFIAAIRHRPNLWLGKKSLASFNSFLAGWQSSEQFHKPDAPIVSTKSLEAFDEWLAKELNTSGGLAFDLIRERAVDDEAAFDLWFDWYKKFEEKAVTAASI